MTMGRRMHTPFQLAKILTVCGVCGAALASSQAWAQDGQSDQSSGVADIVVTAQKRAENMQDVPVAITALSGDDVAKSGVTSTLDLKAAVPSLNFTTGLGGFGLPRIRGLGSTGQGPGIENPVAVYIDGVYIMSATATLLGLDDVEQVAVLKGPQGTLFGRNATGGLIQVTTRKPSHELTGKAQFGYGNYGTVTSSAYVSGGLTDTLAVSVAGDYQNRDEGYGVNVATGHDVQTERSYGGRAKLLWEPTSRTTVTLSGDYAKRSAADPAFAQFGINSVGQPPLADPRNIRADTDPSLASEQYGGSLTIKQGLGDVELMSISAYRESNLHVVLDPDGSNVRNTIVDSTTQDKQFTQELQLQSTGSGPFEWMFGGFYMWGKSSFAPFRTSGFALASLVGSSGYTDTLTDVSLDSYAGFAQASYDISKATKITAGIRYTSDHRSIDASRLVYNSTTGATTSLGVPVNESKVFNKLTWRFSIDHRFSDELMMYASYNRGFRSGTYVPQKFPVSILRPEIVDAYEVGLKSDLFDRKVRLNVAGYYYDQQNVQVTQIISGVQNVYNANGANIYGIDADVTIQATRDMRLTAGVNYTDAKYRSFPDAIVTVPYPLPAGFKFPGNNTACLGTFVPPGRDPLQVALGQIGGNCLLNGAASGNPLQNTPKFTFSVGGNYDLPTSIGTFSLSAQYYYNDGFVATPDARLRQASYNTLDASLTWRPDAGNIFFRVWGKNLTDDLYYNQLSTSNYGDSGSLAPPRTYGATLGFDF
ncbi:TonB-dependent receptor [Sphingopyxis indica]|uniref:TonB-dependent receptor n=1 Tax=Sphingopyxis indica TaxID=436663 RepID=UPI0029394811|nr:TonB-dependent receptor [Sphingopyxis indica]WOF43059.1 TonB-dependent receptor [Sphingopyxis indica]